MKKLQTTIETEREENKKNERVQFRLHTQVVIKFLSSFEFFDIFWVNQHKEMKIA
jgi:hypothetical protein